MATIINDRDLALRSAVSRVEHTIVLVASNNNITLPANSEGVVADNTLANVSITVLLDGLIDTGWTFVLTSTGCTSHTSAGIIVFDGFTVLNTTDSCSILVTASKSGYDDGTLTINISRVRAGATASDLSLTPSQLSLVANYKGDVSSYVDAVSTVKVTTGAADVTGDWALSKVDSPGVITKLTGTEVQVVASVGTQDADCLYALDFDVAPGALTSANILDSSARRRKSTLGIDNATYSAAYLPVTVSNIGPMSGVNSAVMTSNSSGASCIRSCDPTSSAAASDDFQFNSLNRDFSICMYVSFDNINSSLRQVIYSTSSYQPASVSGMGPIALVKAAGSNRIDLVALQYSGLSADQVLISTPATLSSNTFYHIAVNFTKGNVIGRLSLYLNGELCAGYNAPYPGGSAAVVVNLGGLPYSTANTGMNGKIALFRFWSSAKFTTNFDKLSYSYKLPNSDLYSDKVIVGLSFENGKLEDTRGNVFTNTGSLSYHTDSDGTGVLLNDGILSTGLLASLKLTGPYCVELKYKCLSGFDFATTINTPVSFLKLVDKDNNSRFEHIICNPGVLGGSAYTGFNMRNGVSSQASVTCTNSVLTTGTVYHAMAHLDGSAFASRSMYGKLNGVHSTSTDSGPWYHFAGIDEYSLQLGNIQANKGSKWVLYWVRVTSGTRRYDYDFYPPTHLETFNTSAYTDVTATKGTDSLNKRLSINKQISSELTSIFTYDPSFASVSADAYGWVNSLPTTNMSIVLGNSIDTGNWSKTIVNNNGISGNISINSLVVNSFWATNNVHVMLRGDDFNDVSEYRKTFVPSATGSANVPIIINDWSPFGGSGKYYKFSNTTGANNQQHLKATLSSVDMPLSTSDFTYETFFSTTSDPDASTFVVPFWHRGDTDATIFGSDLTIIYSKTAGWRVACASNYQAAFGGSGSVVVFTYTTAPAILTRKTYHVAVVRSGINVYLYINGIRYTAGSTVLPGGFSMYSTSQPLYIGYLPGGVYNSVMRFAQIRFTTGLARYTASTISIPTDPFISETPDTGYIDVLATKAGYPGLTKRFTVNKVKATPLTKPSAAIQPGASSINLTADPAGLVSSYTGASSSMAIMVGGVDDTDNWNFTITKSSSDIGTTLIGNTVNVTSITNSLDSGWIEFSATRSFGTWPTLTYRVSVTKTRVAAPIATLSIPVIAVAGDITGYVPSASYSTATVSMYVSIQGVDDTANWTFTRTSTSGITTSISTNTVSISNMSTSVDSGSIEITATKTGWPTQVLTCSVFKSRWIDPVYPTGATFTKSDIRYNKPASASIKFTTDGKIMTKNSTTAYIQVANWRNPNSTGVGTGHYFRYNVTGASVSGLTSNTWYEISVDRALTLSQAVGDGFVSCELTIDISTNSTGTNIVSTNYALLDVDSYI
jgi:hypothetical protein